jgi:Galactose-3-O-sulfotransferase
VSTVTLEKMETAPQHKRALIFLHLPKCGGTTLNRIIEWEYPPTRIFSIDPSFFRWSHRRLCTWPASRLAKMRVFKGHMPFGLHERLPQPATYITFFREPVERVISEYYFAKNYSLHPQHRRMQMLSLEQYALMTPHHNLQTKLISGRGDYPDFLAGGCDESTLELAKKNLAEHFSFVGLAERFDEGLAVLKLMFGWNITQYAKFNVTATRPEKSKVPEEVQRGIARRNRFDVALYEHAVSLFDKTLAQFGERARAELSAIHAAKSLNAFRSAYYLTASAVRKSICRLQSAL